MTTKAELIEQAEAMGISVDHDDTVDDIEAKMEAARGPQDLGPHVGPDNESDSPGFESVGKIQGVQPETYDDVPEALR